MAGDALNWTITKIAALGCATAAACTPNRKFMMPLDIVEDLDGSFVILVGSGDREKPLEGYTSAASVENFFFKVVDRPTEADWLTTDMGTCSGVICMNALFEIAFDDGDPDADDLLDAPQGPGPRLARQRAGRDLGDHRVRHDDLQHARAALALGGLVHVHAGHGARLQHRLHQRSEQERHLSRSEVVVGGGLPPSPVAGMVTLDDGTTMPFLIGGDPNSPLEGMEPIPSGLAAQPKALQYWYIHK